MRTGLDGEPLRNATLKPFPPVLRTHANLECWHAGKKLHPHAFTENLPVDGKLRLGEASPRFWPPPGDTFSSEPANGSPRPCKQHQQRRESILRSRIATASSSAHNGERKQEKSGRPIVA
ncbi:hypothetical protein PICMEDRAFT_154729 [Pichia membranifaciens NRRL Y-2026]|uniref:Uncharacterized protein n=1 Tax=Pichia membranifaciens NRRL Y-2026 TaxID=763406 RepID=A0A1E3NFH0_9ASCO|nr:hypothetical protein PICMEDRAFT_154729 [Pichia membranifaciens NRRL Y-2026]ODQ44872.1 hypothetical protein PICMEDRAFT_154729 [Pichia membranifaciens NRRL Y-2026]